jgi:class 3 adenylate cyclase
MDPAQRNMPPLGSASGSLSPNKHTSPRGSVVIIDPARPLTNDAVGAIPDDSVYEAPQEDRQSTSFHATQEALPGQVDDKSEEEMTPVVEVTAPAAPAAASGNPFSFMQPQLVISHEYDDGSNTTGSVHGASASVHGASVHGASASVTGGHSLFAGHHTVRRRSVAPGDSLPGSMGTGQSFGTKMTTRSGSTQEDRGLVFSRKRQSILHELGEDDDEDEMPISGLDDGVAASKRGLRRRQRFFLTARVLAFVVALIVMVYVGVFRFNDSALGKVQVDTAVAVQGMLGRAAACGAALRAEASTVAQLEGLRVAATDAAAFSSLQSGLARLDSSTQGVCAGFAAALLTDELPGASHVRRAHNATTAFAAALANISALVGAYPSAIAGKTSSSLFAAADFTAALRSVGSICELQSVDAKLVQRRRQVRNFAQFAAAAAALTNLLSLTQSEDETAVVANATNAELTGRLYATVAALWPVSYLISTSDTAARAATTPSAIDAVFAPANFTAMTQGSRLAALSSYLAITVDASAAVVKDFVSEAEVVQSDTYYYVSGVLFAFVVLLPLTAMAITWRVEQRAQHELRAQRKIASDILESAAAFVPKEFLDVMNYDSIREICLADRREVHITMQFVSIRNYAAIAAASTNAKMFQFQQNLMVTMINATREHRGFIDKFMGDGAFILFREANDALVCAVEVCYGSRDLAVRDSKAEAARAAARKKSTANGNKISDVISSQGASKKKKRSKNADVDSDGSGRTNSDSSGRTTDSDRSDSDSDSGGDRSDGAASRTSEASTAKSGVSNGRSSISGKLPLVNSQRRKTVVEVPVDPKLMSNIGIGIHTGEVCVGILGDELRHSCTLISSKVNLASRLSGLSRKVGVEILMSGVTAAEAMEDPMCQEMYFRDLGDVQVYGQTVPNRVVELFATNHPDIVDYKTSTMAQWQRAMELRAAGQYADAKMVLRDIRAEMIANMADSPARLLPNGRAYTDEPLELKMRSNAAVHMFKEK